MVWFKDKELAELDPDNTNNVKLDLSRLSEVKKRFEDKLVPQDEIKSSKIDLSRLSEVKKRFEDKIELSEQPNKKSSGASGSWANPEAKNIDLSKDINKELPTQEQLDKKTSISDDSLFSQVKKFDDGLKMAVKMMFPGQTAMLDLADKARAGIIGEENNQYLNQSFVAGLTQGILPNDSETDNTALKVAGVIANGIGTVATGWLLPEVRVFKTMSSGAKAVSTLEKVAAPFFKEGVKAKIKSVGLKNLAKETVNTMATGFVYGAATEGLRSFIAGEDGEDTLASTIMGSILGAGIGLVAGPVLTGVGAFAGRKTLGKLKQTIKTNLEKPEIVNMVEQSALALNRGDVKAYVAANAEKFANKVKDINPVIMPWELVARPELLLKENKSMVDNMVDDLFLKPNAPAAEIYNKSDHLKRLVESGKKVDALQQYSTMVRAQTKANQPLQEYIKEPFILDRDILPTFMADVLLSKNKYQGLGQEARGKLINYFDQPNAQNEADLMLVVNNKNKPVFKMAQGKRDLAATVNGNIRLNSEQVDDLLSQQLSSMFNGLSNRSIGEKGVQSLSDFDGFLNAMTTLNKPLFRTVAQAFVSNKAKEDIFLNVESKDIPMVESLLNRRIDREHLSWLVKQRISLNDKIKNTSDSAIIESFKNDLKKNNRAISRVQNRISASEIGLNGQSIPQAELERLTNIADSIFIPRIDSINKKLSPEIAAKINAKESIRGQAIKNAIFNRDNPNIIKDMTDFSDILQAMDYAGYDVNLGNSGGILKDFSNIQRKAADEFGLNSPFQKIFNVINRQDIAKIQFKNYWMKELRMNNPDLKPGSKANKFLADYLEGKLTKTNEAGNIVELPEFKALSAREQEAIKKASKWMPDALTNKILQNGVNGPDFSFESINDVLARNGDKTINPRTVDAQGNPVQYMPYYGDSWSIAKAKFVAFLKGEKDPTNFTGISPDIPLRGPQRKKASFERARSGLSEAKGIKRLGAIESFEKYVSDAADIIYGTDLSKSIYAASNFAPSQIGQSLRDIADRYVIGIPDETLNTIHGKILSEMRRRISNAVLLGNPGVAVQQLLSIPLNAAIGGKEAFTAIFKRATKDGKDAIAMSQNLYLRDIKSEGFELGKGLVRQGLRKLGKGGNAAASTLDMYEGFMGETLRVFDKEAATHAYLTGYQKGIKAGLKPEEAAKYGDYMVGLLHGQMTKIGQPQFMQSVYGRTLMQFQSFATNMFSTLKDDLPKIVMSDGPTKSFNNIVRAYMNMTLTNEVLRDNGLPPQFDLGSFFPPWEGNRGNIPGSVGVVMNILNFISQLSSGKYETNKKPKPGSYFGIKGTDLNSDEALNRAENDLINLTGIPGARSMVKWIKGSDKDLKKEVRSPWIGKIYGTKAKGFKKDTIIDKRNKSTGTILRKKIKEFID